MTSQSGGTKTVIKSSKLFELTLASLNCRYIFLSCALKLTEIGQFAWAKAGLWHVSDSQNSASMMCNTAESRSIIFVATQHLQ